MRQCGLVLVPLLPPAPLSPPTSPSPPLVLFGSHFLLSLSIYRSLPSHSANPPTHHAAPFASCTRSEPDVWFWAQMALACLWLRIKPPASPFPLSPCASGQDKERQTGEGGKECEEKPRDCETTPDTDVSWHSWKSKLKAL